MKMIKKINSNVNTLHFFSDGPSTQYKQKQNFYFFTRKIFEYGFSKGTWSFFESGHGKGAADGIGGVLKRTADRIVAHGGDITDSNDFVKMVQKETSAQMFSIEGKDIDNNRKSLPFYIPALPGTLKVHQIVVEKENTLMYRDLSCFCKNIENNISRGFCRCYDPKEFQFQRLPIYSAIYSPTVSSESSLADEESQNKDKFDHISKGSFLLISISGRKGQYRFVGIAQNEIEENDEIKVIFLKSMDKGKNNFLINEDDESYIHSSQIIKVLPNPTLKLKGGRIFYNFDFEVDIHET